MSHQQSTDQLLERVYARYPEERDRVEEVARKVREMDQWMVTKAFDHALEKLLEAKTASEAKGHIDTLDYILVSSHSYSTLKRENMMHQDYFFGWARRLLILTGIFSLVYLALIWFE